MASLNHVHSYIRVGGGHDLSKQRWKCNDPYCTHVTSRELVMGKISACECGDEFVLDKESMRRRAPKCLNCAKTKKAQLHRAAQEVMSSLLSEESDGHTN